MKKINIIFIVFSVFACSACEKVLDFDGEIKDSKIVVNSLFNTEDTFRLHLSNSLSLIDDSELKYLKDATVKLYDNNNTLVSSPTHTQNGYYTDPDFKFGEGLKYKVVVENEGYKTVESSDVVPRSVKVTALDTQIVRSQDGYEEMMIALDFSDPIGTNYYMVEVQMLYTYRFDSTFIQHLQTAYLNSIDPNIATNNSNGAYYGQRLIINDNRFDGKDYTFRFNMDKYVLRGENNKVSVRFYSLSESAYNYFTSLQRYDNVQGDPFATPVQVFSNVENGFGIFGGSSIDIKLLKE